ncbi:MAG: topoisomerase DNA-binding C4 zinc finger domain-containing protein [Planctomycetota bacterium]|jgi:hypothetical protein
MALKHLRMHERAYSPAPELSWKKEPGGFCWIAPGGDYTCPLCDKQFAYAGPQNPGLRFLCPFCNFWIVWYEVGSVTQTELIPPKCNKCAGPTVERNGKYGKFFGCSSYPKCKGKGVGPRRRVNVQRAACDLREWTPPDWKPPSPDDDINLNHFGDLNLGERLHQREKQREHYRRDERRKWR